MKLNRCKLRHLPIPMETISNSCRHGMEENKRFGCLIIPPRINFTMSELFKTARVIAQQMENLEPGQSVQLDVSRRELALGVTAVFLFLVVRRDRLGIRHKDYRFAWDRSPKGLGAELIPLTIS